MSNLDIIMNTCQEEELISTLDELPFWSAPFGFELLNQIQIKKNMQVLDIGCGLGFPLIQLAQMLGKSSTCIGIDPSVASTKRAKFKIEHQGIENVQIINAIAEEMPFENNSFDLIISNNGLNNVSNFESAIKEIKRVAKKGCQLVFSMNTNQTFSQFYFYLIETLKEFSLDECIELVYQHIDEKRPPVEKISELINSYGFQIQNITYKEFYYRFLDGTSFLDSFFIKYAFIPSWMKILPETNAKEIMKEVENKLNKYAINNSELKLEVPFFVLNSINR